MYEQYVFKHLMVYVIRICVSQDRFRLLHKWKKFQSVNGTATENHSHSGTFFKIIITPFLMLQCF